MPYLGLLIFNKSRSYPQNRIAEKEVLELLKQPNEVMPNVATPIADESETLET